MYFTVFKYSFSSVFSYQGIWKSLNSFFIDYFVITLYMFYGLSLSEEEYIKNNFFILFYFVSIFYISYNFALLKFSKVVRTFLFYFLFAWRELFYIFIACLKNWNFLWLYTCFLLWKSYSFGISSFILICFGLTPLNLSGIVNFTS